VTKDSGKTTVQLTHTAGSSTGTGDSGPALHAEITDTQDPAQLEGNHGATDELRLEAQFNWADDLPETEQTPKATGFLPEEPSKAENE
jgi:hypothetical protein